MRTFTIVLALLGSSGLATAQSYQPSPTINPRTDVNVATSDLGLHPPGAIVHTKSKLFGATTKTLSLYAWTRRGLSVRTFDSNARAWTDWRHLGTDPKNPPLRPLGFADPMARPGLDTMLLPRSGFTTDHTLHYGYATSRETGLGRAGLDLGGTSPTWNHLVPSMNTIGGALNLPTVWQVFDPQAGIRTSDRQGRDTERIFGTGMPFGAPQSNAFQWNQRLPLIELRQPENGAPTWIDHGMPPNVDSVTVGPDCATTITHQLAPGEYRGDCCDPFDQPGKHGNAACIEGATCCGNGAWVCNQGDGRAACGSAGQSVACYGTAEDYVFASGNPRFDAPTGSYLNDDPTVHYLYSDDAISWRWRNLGAPSGRQVYGSPVVASYFSANPLAGGTGMLAVFVTALDPATNKWTLYLQHHDGGRWQSSWTKLGVPPNLASGERFRMTSAVVWYQGTYFDWSGLRIEVFGQSEGAGEAPGKLVHYRWNGGSWSFAPTRAAPDGRTLHQTSADTIDLSGYDRVSAFVRTTDGRIYEYFYDGGAWVWHDLSYEPLLVATTPRPCIFGC